MEYGILLKNLTPETLASQKKQQYLVSNICLLMTNVAYSKYALSLFFSKHIVEYSNNMKEYNKKYVFFLCIHSIFHSSYYFTH
jgi:hypothetical protein